MANRDLVEQRVTYTLEVGSKLFVVENVPARVDQETGEQFFSPETVERLQEIVHGQENVVDPIIMVLTAFTPSSNS